mmetsp:Transcript_2824/g.7936  ORF Transcript_2824/g.7936 Transcript_2824/m.7936 type:complete len:107 (+) Transcript_2824:566-886(+)
MHMRPNFSIYIAQEQQQQKTFVQTKNKALPDHNSLRSITTQQLLYNNDRIYSNSNQNKESKERNRRAKQDEYNNEASKQASSIDDSTHTYRYIQTISQLANNHNKH